MAAKRSDGESDGTAFGEAVESCERAIGESSDGWRAIDGSSDGETADSRVGNAADGEAIGEAFESSDGDRPVGKASDGERADSGAIGEAADGEAIDEAVAEPSDGGSAVGKSSDGETADS